MENYTLHARERELLHFLNSRHGIVSAKEISKKMAISERTIRSDIARINQAMETSGIFIRTVYGKGYSLEIRDRAVFHRLFSEEKNIQTKEDRIRYLILKLVRSEESCDMNDLEEDIYISRTTLETDLREVKARISENQPYLQIERRGNKIWVEENELKRRNILIHLYCKDWDYDSRDGIALTDSVIEKETLNQIRIETKQVLDEFQIELDDFGLIYLTLALAVCYSRALEQKELILPESWNGTESMESRKKYEKAVFTLLNRLSKIWELLMEADVYRWMSVILSQLSILNLRYISWQEALEKTDSACAEVEKELLLRVKEQYGMSLVTDENFCTILLLHIQALRNGMISFQPQNRYVLDSLRIQYPFLGDVAHYMCMCLEKFCRIKLGMDEENYLLPLLVLAQTNELEKQKGQNMRIAVVSHFNSGLTYYLLKRLERSYGMRIKFDGPFPVYDRKWMETVKPACILTTVQMDVFRRFDVPVITVSAQLTRNELEKIERQIQKIEEKCLYRRLPRERSHYFRSDLVLSVKQKMSLEEVMDIMAERVRNVGIMKYEFSPDWENCYYTLLTNGMLFTYIMGDMSSDSVFSMADLETVTVWKHQKGIRKVLLLLLNPSERKYLSSFYQLAQDIAEHNAF